MYIFILAHCIFLSILAYGKNNDLDVFIVDSEKLIATKTDNKLVGNVNRGRQIFSSRKVNCLSCHEAPIKEEKFHGNFGPSLSGIGAIYNKDEIRLRVINSKIINPNSIMPSYFIKINFPRTPKKYSNKTILSPQEVEDLVEYLYSLR
tara:strand:+ start:63 stop:506 length:444 start_codon:yes stop_codon:yes gene_type:complete